MRKSITRFGLYFAWLIALIATSISLYTSEVLGIEPCTLCWYQRICLFSLVITLAVAAYRREKHVRFYALPQAGLGVLIALYQFIGYQGVSEGTCLGNVQCSEHLLQVGVMYPLVSLMTFILIGAFVICAHKGEKQTGGNK